MVRKFPVISFTEKLGLSQKIFLASIILSIGLGKWGAWIGLPNLGIFLIDLMFFGSLFVHSLINADRVKYSKNVSIILFVFILIQTLRSQDSSVPVVLRDLIPFVYLASIPYVIEIVSTLAWSDLISSIRVGVLINLFWTIPVTVGILDTIQIFPDFVGVPLFTHRYDLTGIVLALGIIFFGKFDFINLRSSMALRSICLALGLLQSSRAATIAVLLALLFVILQTSSSQKRRLVFWVPITVGIFACVIVIFSSSFESFTSKSSLARFGLIGDDSFASESAKNTSAARVRAAQKLLSWFDDQNQTLLGVGPGTEMVQLSGAYTDLSGSVEVRAVHNWFISVYVRFGVIGTIIWTFIVLRGFYLSRNLKNWCWRVSIIIICIVAGMGVIIESPFGSLPFAFLVALTYTERDW